MDPEPDIRRGRAVIATLSGKMPAAMDYEELPPVYLVVGTATRCKTYIAETLAAGLFATKMETSLGGVRTFAEEDNVYPEVVDTVPFQSLYAEDTIWIRCARVWISKNELRRLFGRKVILVVVVNTSTPLDYVPERYVTYPVVSWLNLAAYIFKEYPESEFVLLNSKYSMECQATAERWRDVLMQEGIDSRRIVLANLSRSGLPLLDDRLRDTDCIRPFLLKEVTRKDTNSRSLRPWAPESVMLFGRTGCGKTTLAQMLTSGRLDPGARKTSSGIRGATTQIGREEGRGWYIVDTPGFGEPQHQLSSTSTTVAEKLIKKYVQIIEGTYSHYLYVVKKDRIDQLEERLWEFFCLLFGADLKYFFTVVVSGADEDWVAENRADLERVFEGCKSFVGADFPPIQDDDEEWEAENQQTRAESLKAVEEELASRERYDVFCMFGRFSSLSAAEEIATLNDRAGKSASKKLANRIRVVISLVYADLRRLINVLIRDDKIFLVPLLDDSP